ncbi:uncharacterized protein LOC127873603 isoform X2 [Dreissena polymorpha]|uniref:uncharacterized protein LOC127873603 isoform X1 n=1 Tax=Dreissena polymorpha TaxID=45954 RepID=UPI002263DF34|nr:uncharacterized protein LOC127873603 isoform X1 [Dreissena polymorpha]XP_052273436.1 uncharacterized protein LOC127873603 isoform X2 [Dreissena polymorpha]
MYFVITALNTLLEVFVILNAFNDTKSVKIYTKMDMLTLQTLLVFTVGIYEVTAGEWCFVQKTFGSGSEYQYCSWGCCTFSYRTQCCTVNYTTNLQTNVGFFIGKIVGGVIGLIVLVSIIVVCCCIIKRKRARQGQILQSTNGQEPVFGTPGTEMVYAQQPYQPYPIQTTNMVPGYMSAPTQPTQPWRPPPYEEVNKGFTH